MANAGFDESLEDLMKADAIRASLVPGAAKNFYLVEEPWTMLEEPWRCQWFDKQLSHLCEVNVVALPHSGDKYALFTVITTKNKVVNYVFLTSQYHFIEGRDESIDD